jgi:hypothetical protein
VKREKEKGLGLLVLNGDLMATYIYGVDQASISFVVTNFPKDCNTEDLWRLFARLGRLGDVYIPKKVDKWGKI